jgi:molybdopterin converting factor small subunit
MINIWIGFLDKKSDEDIYIAINEGSDISDLMRQIYPLMKTEDFYYIVGSTIVFSSYILKDYDKVKIFPAMCGG